MFQGIPQPDTTQLEDLKREHLQTLSSPLDGYWEGALIGFSEHFLLRIEDSRAGYYCINSDRQMVAFHLSKKYAMCGEAAMAYILKENGTSAALAGTNDSFFLSLCLDKAIQTQVHTLLFEDNRKEWSALAKRDQFSFSLATKDDFETVFKHYCDTSESQDTENIEVGFESLKGYIRSVMEDHHIFILREKNNLIATSECRISKTQKPYADLGMIVAKEHRRKGVGSYILARTKEFCYEKNLRPICSCEASNIGSQKAIRKAGFVSRNRVVLVGFKS